MSLLPSPEAVVKGYELACRLGMHQHEGEIRPFAALLSARHTHNVLEIGTLKGGTVALWASLSVGRVVSVDLPNGTFGAAHHGFDRVAMLERNYALQQLFPGRFFGVLGDSHDPEVFTQVSRYVSDVDLLFIDGDHTLEGVKKDFEMYKLFVRSGGLIVFHDILDTPIHREANCRVDLLWQQIKNQYRHHEFCINGGWGGIGVLEVR